MDSIFGDVSQGVPNPHVPHRHPYPTRFHGPVFTVPRFRGEYRSRPYKVATVLGRSPDGLGAEPLVPLTRSAAADAVLGAAVGWLGAPRRGDALMYAVGGGVVTWLAGAAGLGALMGFELYQAHVQGSLRSDLHGG